MKRLYKEGALSLIAGFIGFFFGVADGHKVFSSVAFQITFGLVAAILLVLVVGGGILQEIDRRHVDQMKKRVRFSFEKDKTSIVVEPKEST